MIYTNFFNFKLYKRTSIVVARVMNDFSRRVFFGYVFFLYLKFVRTHPEVTCTSMLAVVRSGCGGGGWVVPLVPATRLFRRRTRCAFSNAMNRRRKVYLRFLSVFCLFITKNHTVVNGTVNEIIVLRV